MLYSLAKEEANQQLPECWKYGITAPWDERFIFSGMV